MSNDCLWPCLDLPPSNSGILLRQILADQRQWEGVRFKVVDQAFDLRLNSQVVPVVSATVAITVGPREAQLALIPVIVGTPVGGLAQQRLIQCFPHPRQILA